MLSLDRVCFHYPGPVAALRDVSLALAPGECLAVLGSVGSGKTTLLRLLAGLETPTAGHIHGLPIPTALVAQRHVLYPHLTVRQNLTFGLSAPDLSAAEPLRPLFDRTPDQLSGGQAQRVALTRAVVRGAQLVLLDEPLAHLEPAARWERLCELDLLRRASGITMMFVTHEREEAFAVADRIAVLHHGSLLQVGAPNEVHDRPSSLVAARLLAWPQLNVLRGTIRHDVTGVHVVLAAGPVLLPSPLNRWGRFAGREILLGSRPDCGLVLPLRGERRVPGPAHGWRVGSVGGEVVTVREGVTPFEPAGVHLFDVTSGEALAHGSAP